jgi:quercetin dioxygenase-like cupin family protein
MAQPIERPNSDAGDAGEKGAELMLMLSRVAVVSAAVALFGMATFALASPPSGQQTTPPVTGTLDPVRAESDGIKLRTAGPVVVTTFTLTLGPGGFTGWHTHPGVLIATVQSGAVLRDVGCETRRYEVGQSFVEHGAEPTGQVRNASVTAPATFTITQMAPPGIARRAETDPPRCGGDREDRPPDSHSDPERDGDE